MQCISPSGCVYSEPHSDRNMSKGFLFESESHVRGLALGVDEDAAIMKDDLFMNIKCYYAINIFFRFLNSPRCLMKLRNRCVQWCLRFFLFAGITMTTVITALKYPLNEIYTY